MATRNTKTNKPTTKKPNKEIIDKLKEEVIIPEAYLVGLYWNNPYNYSFITEEKLNSDTFANGVWGFWYGLGKELHKKEVVKFDDISVMNVVKELNIESYFDKYGGFEIIREIQDEVEGFEENLDSYYKQIKKYKLIRDMCDLMGPQVVEVNGKYNYKDMTEDQIATYWRDKVNQVALNVDSVIKDYDLLDDLRGLIDELDNDPDFGMPFYNSEKLTDIINGWAFGTITLLSGFSGNGKTSLAVEKILLSCVKESEKLMIIANEMGIKAFKKLLLISIMGSKEFYDTHKLKGFNRKNINKGGFSEEDKAKLHLAVDWIEENVQNKQLIKFVPLEDYTIENVEKVIRYYGTRGYKRMILDTAKPTTTTGNKQRWEVFVNDFDKIYQLIRPEVGLNIAMFCTIQAADEALKYRYLDERCIGDGKKIKNVVDTVFHMRPVWDSEMDGGDNAIEVFKWVPNPNKSKADEKPYVKEKIKLDYDKTYYLLFCSKNRRGQSNLTGLDILVFEVNFNSNRWREIGWTTIMKDGNYF